MPDGISRITNGKGLLRPDRVTPKKDREREEQLDFAEEMEQRGHEETAEETPTETNPTQGLSQGGNRPVGYRTDEEAGGALDLTA